MQLDIQTLPIVTGFGVGGLIFLLQRTLSVGLSRKQKGTNSPGDQLGEVEFGPTPAAEPGPEPSPEQECFHASRALISRGTVTVAVLTMASVSGVLLLAILSGKEGRASALVEPTGAARANMSIVPVRPDTFAEFNISMKDDTSAELIDVNASAAVSSVEVASPTEDDSSAESFTSEDNPDEGSKGTMISLNLTRQQMAIHTVGDIVYYKSAYWGTIKVGDPLSTFKVVFDTGSGHLILPSTYCKSETCRVHKRYRRSTSRSAKDIDYDGTVVKAGEPRDQITISFGTGEVTGVFVEDTVCLENSDHRLHPATAAARWEKDAAGPLSCMSLRMIAATDMSEEPFKSFHFDGVVGLGLSGLSQAPEFNFLAVLAKSASQGGSNHGNRFAVFLGEHEEEVSEITLGGFVDERAQSRLAWNRVLHPELGHWMLEVKSVRVGSHTLDFCKEGCRAVLDTGTSLLAIPTPSFPEIYELLRHPADVALECRGGPKLHFDLERFTVTLEAQDYSRLENNALVSPLPEQRLREPGTSMAEEDEDRVEFCKPMLMSMDLPAPIGPKLFVLGEPVLRKYYSVYDTDSVRPRIGLSQAVHSQPSKPNEDDDSWFFED